MTSGTLTLLEREMYTEAEAARLLNVPPATLHYWLEGKTGRAGKIHPPVIRTEPKGPGAAVTWAEFVEAGALRQYRKDMKLKLQDLRSFVDELRERFGIPYPLADLRPLVSGREIVLEAQEQSGLPGELWLVTRAGGQLLLTPASESFVRRARWDGDVATGWRPHDDEDSPVLIDPEVRFGRPAVNGVSTEILWEHADDGEDEDEIAQVFGLTAAEVSWAVIYEKTRRTKQVRRSA
jgi:uncharacterized protein (DUF433 family)